VNTEPELSVFCPYYQRAIELVGSRWTGAVLRALTCEVERFSDLKDAIPGLSDRMLSERLKALEAEGIVQRDVLPLTPVRVEYHLTAKGQALWTAMAALATWAETWLPDDAAPVAVLRD
jgi:DNA-binding HxlR family transcriptional regulator